MYECMMEVPPAMRPRSRAFQRKPEQPYGVGVCDLRSAICDGGKANPDEQ